MSKLYARLLGEAKRIDRMHLHSIRDRGLRKRSYSRILNATPNLIPNTVFLRLSQAKTSAILEVARSHVAREIWQQRRNDELVPNASWRARVASEEEGEDSC